MCCYTYNNNNMNVEEDPSIYIESIYDDLPPLVSPNDDDLYSSISETTPFIDEYTQYDDLHEFLQGIDFLNSIEEPSPEQEYVYEYANEHQPIINRFPFFE